MVDGAKQGGLVGGRYHVRELFNVPGLLSLLRLPLAALVVVVLDRPWLALVVLAAAGVSDVLDGWWARRARIVSATGAALDPVTDKAFAFTVAIALVACGRLSLGQVVLLHTRELGELPLVAWILVSHRARLRRAEHASANFAGKLATTLQFVAIGAALFAAPLTPVWICATAIAGVVAAAVYWRREMRVLATAPPHSRSAVS